MGILCRGTLLGNEELVLRTHPGLGVVADEIDVELEELAEAVSGRPRLRTMFVAELQRLYRSREVTSRELEQFLSDFDRLWEHPSGIGSDDRLAGAKLVIAACRCEGDMSLEDVLSHPRCPRALQWWLWKRSPEHCHGLSANPNADPVLLGQLAQDLECWHNLLLNPSTPESALVEIARRGRLQDLARLLERQPGISDAVAIEVARRDSQNLLGRLWWRKPRSRELLEVVARSRHRAWREKAERALAAMERASSHPLDL